MNPRAVSLALQATLAVAAVLLAPALGRRRFVRLREEAARDRSALSRAYLRSMATQWVAAGAALVSIALGGGPAAAYFLRLPALGDSPFVSLPDAGVLGVSLAVGGAVGICAAILRARAPRAREAILRQLAAAQPLLPRTRGERLLWVGLSLSAGFCEELVYRAAIPVFLAGVLEDAPLGALLAVLAFGLGHAWQGARGMIGTTVLGGYLAFIVLCTQSLWPAAALHALVNLRILALPRLDPRPPRE